jgi:integrase
MGRACDRAGLERRGAHRLRHALATGLLHADASLPEVGQVLRHRSAPRAAGAGYLRLPPPGLFRERLKWRAMP